MSFCRSYRPEEMIKGIDMNRKRLIFTDGSTMETGTFYCIGQNYAKHAKEMGSAVSPDPTVFIKPPAALVNDGERVSLPEISDNVHHEVELVVVIGRDCENVPAEDALNVIAGYAVGIDLTMRDLQNKAKSEGKPWAICKGFKNSAPLSKIIPATMFEDIPHFLLQLSVNGILKQSGSTSEMERSVGNLVSFISEIFTLRAGDAIFTGTPEGVGQVFSGDKITARLNDLVELNITIL